MLQEGDGEDHDGALRRREIARHDGADGEPSDAGPREHRLGHHRAAQQERRLQADQGDDRDQRVAQRVMDDHHRLAQALGARRAHEVGAQHLQHGGARQPRDRPDQHRAQGRRRQDQAGQAAVPDRAGAAGEGQQRPFEADILDQDQADEEHRHGHARHRDRHDQAVDHAAALHRRQGAERQAERHGDQHGAHHQLDGRADGEAELLGHHLVGDDRAAEIAAQHAADILDELDGDRPVEPELEADGGDGVGLGVGAGDDHRRIGRHDLQQAEAKEENPEQSGERDQQAVDDLSSHAPSSDRLDQGHARRFSPACLDVAPWQPRFGQPCAAFTCSECDRLARPRHAHPPACGRTWPVMKPAPSEHRKQIAAPSSSDLPSRPIGICAVILAIASWLASSAGGK